jgi:hypothetical protein
MNNFEALTTHKNDSERKNLTIHGASVLYSRQLSAITAYS